MHISPKCLKLVRGKQCIYSRSALNQHRGKQCIYSWIALEYHKGKECIHSHIALSYHRGKTWTLFTHNTPPRLPLTTGHCMFSISSPLHCSHSSYPPHTLGPRAKQHTLLYALCLHAMHSVSPHLQLKGLGPN